MSKNLNINVRSTFFEEIESVPGTAGLSLEHAAFAQHIAMGFTAADAYRETVIPGNSQLTDKQVAQAAQRLRYQPSVQKYMAKINERLEDMGVAKSVDAQLWLTQAVHTPIGLIDEFSPLCQEKRVKKTTDPDGTETIEVVLKMVSKIEAQKMLNKMKGFDAPIKVAVDVTQKSGVMVVPQSSTVEEWEAAASTTQISLMGDAVNI